MKPLRIYYLVAKRGPEVAAVFLVLGAIALGGAGWVYAHPPTTQVTERTNEQTVRTEPSTWATATGNTSLYEAGTTLEDQPVYLAEAAPRLNLTLRTTLPTASPPRVEQRLELVYTASRSGDVFWVRTEPLPVRTTRNGRQVVSNASLSVARVNDRLERYQQDLGRGGTVSVGVRATVSYRLDDYRGEMAKTYPLTIGPEWYALETKPLSKTHSTSVTRTVAVPDRNELPYLVPGAAGGLLLVAGVATGGLYYGRFSRESPDELAAGVHHRRYAEWISNGTLPQSRAGTVVHVASLEDLVDVAIDSNKRVIYDPDRDRYAVLDGDVRYCYRPPGATGSTGEETEFVFE